MLKLNDFGYAVLNDEYLAKYMGKDVLPASIDPFDKDSIDALLGHFGIGQGPHQAIDTLLNEEHFVPPMLAGTIDSHFDEMAKELIAPALSIIDRLIESADLGKLPQGSYADQLVEYAKPNCWLKLTTNGHSYVNVPDTDWLVFDTETFVQGSRTNMPIIATGIGQDADGLMAMYLWAHESLLDNSVPYSPQLVPVGTGKVIIMHNSEFDAPRMRERYELDSLNNYILCTQSMHQCTNGFDGSQRWAKNMAKDNRHGKAGNYPAFVYHGSGASLVDAYEFHTGKLLSNDAKDPRALFVNATDISQISERLYDCFDYAIHDVLYTLELFIALWPKYRKIAPSPVVLAGHMMLANCALPVRNDWHEWCQRTEQAWQSANKQISLLLNQLADLYHAEWQQNPEAIEQDCWLKNLDWRRCSTNKLSPLYNVAKWYESRHVFGTLLSIGAKGRDSHYLLKLCWNGKPLQYHKDWGWHYLNSNGKEERVYHAKGDDSNVGSVLTSTYIKDIAEGRLHSFDETDTRPAQIAKLIVQTSFWTGNRSRILALHAEPIENPYDGSRMLVVAPNLRAHGTASGRAVENVFLVAASHTAPKIGSEIAHMAYAPMHTHKFVGHDVDAQELQICRIYGDSYSGMSGSTPFASAILVGDKKQGTDFHSLTAKSAGTGRDAAKQVNYLALYGGGAKAAVRTIRLWHPDYAMAEAKTKAAKLIKALKGTKDWQTGKFYNGLASASFNKMADIMLSPRPSTPILNTAPSYAMWPEHNGKGVTPGLLNHAVQAAASSFGMLSCLLVGSQYLFNKYSIKASFAVSRHDEYQFLVPKQDAYKAAYLMQINHAWCWALTQYKSRVYDLPIGVAFASAINIDSTWRKNANAKLETPTFNYAVPNGQELDMLKLIKTAKAKHFFN